MLPILAALILTAAAPDTIPAPPDPALNREELTRASPPDSGATRDPFVLLGVAGGAVLPARAALAADSERVAPAAQRGTVEHSDLYYTRLTIHRWSSYATVPLMVAQWVVGQRLDDEGDDDVEGDDDEGGNLRSTHQTIAGGLAGAFAINTVTGGWNLIESWKEPGKVRKIHSVLMLLADAAFVGTFATAPEDDGDSDTHRTLAIAGGGLAVTGFALMIPTLLGRD